MSWHTTEATLSKQPNNGTYIYRFSKKTQEGTGTMKAELGGKGAALAEMSRLGMPVPPGFTISTAACRYYLDHGVPPPTLKQELRDAMQWLEAEHGKKFNDRENLLLVSVRSGAAVSMPGMMDTILNVGLHEGTLWGLARTSSTPRFAFDSYRRLLQMFGTVVLKIQKKHFDDALHRAIQAARVETESDLTPDALYKLGEEFSEIIKKETGAPFPSNPEDQLDMAIEAVFHSWQNDRARTYRALNGIPDDSGTAVTIQAMAFGNSGPDSGTGVGFTRNPSTGVPEMFGEFLADAQGEDIVAGTRTPLPVAELDHILPDAYKELCDITTRLEKHYRDAQDFEFTVEHGKLFLLQTRSAKRSGTAAVRMAVEMANEGLISRLEAIKRIKPSSINEILCPQLDLSAGTPEIIAEGLAASPGAAVGRIALSADKAVVASAGGKVPVILVSQETTAEDIHGMAAAVGLLTAHGGATSHAAVVARGMGKCCITGAHAVHVDPEAGLLEIGGHSFADGDWISLDGSTGRVFAGKLPLRASDGENPYLKTLLEWSLAYGPAKVRANADTPPDAEAAYRANATGIGLCRTEHMFFAPERLPAMRAMILAEDTAKRETALVSLLPMQQSDFERIFRSMPGLPVTIRLLDPPLHEFLPAARDVSRDLAAALMRRDTKAATELETLLRRIDELSETNPMMGHRGCRLSITFPEILTMQVTAILQAALAVEADGLKVSPEIMVPLVATPEEIGFLRHLIDQTAAKVFASASRSIPYTVGTMIELPRAALVAETLAPFVDFVSFGTNDLTQMTFGFSRDDSKRFVDAYIEKKILTTDPFLTIDRKGVGSLIAIAIDKLRSVKPQIKIGVCGEHAGDPDSIAFFATLALDYVSCSPARLPLAQLAMAHAGAEKPKEKAQTQPATSVRPEPTLIHPIAQQSTQTVAASAF
jgi:pyruvate,orthophosphate dikinase